MLLGSRDIAVLFLISVITLYGSAILRWMSIRVDTLLGQTKKKQRWESYADSYGSPSLSMRTVSSGEAVVVPDIETKYECPPRLEKKRLVDRFPSTHDVFNEKESEGAPLRNEQALVATEDPPGLLVDEGDKEPSALTLIWDTTSVDDTIKKNNNSSESDPPGLTAIESMESPTVPSVKPFAQRRADRRRRAAAQTLPAISSGDALGFASILDELKDDLNDFGGEGEPPATKSDDNPRLSGQPTDAPVKQQEPPISMNKEEQNAAATAHPLLLQPRDSTLNDSFSSHSSKQQQQITQRLRHKLFQKHHFEIPDEGRSTDIRKHKHHRHTKSMPMNFRRQKVQTSLLHQQNVHAINDLTREDQNTMAHLLLQQGL